ncbi:MULTISPECIES: cysteine--tRNA ligase [unclassified Synechocystis]|uniref:cysteine--tRNA ligase n=1 Tax=unclassified Synechocystis TaxID=2640012 RepID=UPI00048D7ED1|nr:MULTISPECIES: cysteine--tRNA ligase [unclassified Synechocystis]MCT0255252.1 cysteine--tRNA ligase [Synechocystis sp. CS-94]
MTLRLYDSLTRAKQTLQSLRPGLVTMYCCGITVYDYCHLGHARTCITWDLVRRYLEWSGYEVRYVQNFTDIDDKILKRAMDEGSTMEAVSEKFIAAYFEDMEALGVQPADLYPRATHTLDGIRRLIAELEAKGYAYPAAGDVYYSVRNFAGYGKLSGRRLEDLQAGASGRVADADGAHKQDPFDFALWKSAKPGEPAWESPWGKGRPGWHIECSAMVREFLGETIDLHVGGNDLIFPHHENEIAQSEAVTGQPLAQYWLHNGMVKVDGEKMSKSLGNFTTIRALLKTVDSMAIRLLVLQGHYRKPLDFTDTAIAAATNGWQTLTEGLKFGHDHSKDFGWDLEDFAPIGPNANQWTEAFQQAVDDDFNFAGGLAVLFELAKHLRSEGNKLKFEGITQADPDLLKTQWTTLVSLAEILGLRANLDSPSATNAGLTDTEIEQLVTQRTQARKDKNWAEGDRLRDLLQEAGITLVDKPGGVTVWFR